MTTGANCQAAMCAYTEERQIRFRIEANVNALSKENILEVKGRIERLPRDRAVFQGIEIRHTLTVEQKREVMEQIAEVTRNDFEYCVEHGKIRLSKHIVEDYLRASPEVLNQRGWSTDEYELYGQVIQTILQVQTVEKAMIHFEHSGRDKIPLTHTITGKEETRTRKLSLAIRGGLTGRAQTIVAVTLLRSQVRSSVCEKLN